MEGYGNENPGAFQPTRPLRGTTDNSNYESTTRTISTHAPLAGHDVHAVVTFNHGNISTHAPLAGHDDKRMSTQKITINFNPRAPCGARPLSKSIFDFGNNFNPRAPCGARLMSMRRTTAPKQNFNPRAPCGARLVGVLHGRPRSISTHAPLAGHDVLFGCYFCFCRYFNPRAPCGARPLRGCDKSLE